MRFDSRVVHWQAVDVAGYRVAEEPDLDAGKRPARFVCSRGYQVSKQAPHPGTGEPRWGFERTPEASAVTLYTTLEEDPSGELPFRPAAYADFAAVDVQDDASVLGFADVHGLLGLEASPAEKVLRGGARVERERLSDWAPRVAEMGAAVALLDAIEAGNVERLREWIRFGDDAVRIRFDYNEGRPEPEPEPEGRLEPEPEATWVRVRKGERLYDELSASDLPHTARLLLMRVVNKRLRELTHGSMLYNPDTKHPELRIRPRGLLGAMWLQVSLELEGRRERYACTHCGKWQVREQGYRRSDRAYCGERCRVAAHRARKARALEMHRAGHGVAAIATELKTDESKVSGWLGGRRERPRISARPQYREQKRRS